MPDFTVTEAETSTEVYEVRDPAGDVVEVFEYLADANVVAERLTSEAAVAPDPDA